MHALSGIQTHDPSVRASEDISYFRPRGHCDRREVIFFPPLALQPPWALASNFQFHDDFTDGRTPWTSQGRYLSTRQHRHRINIYRYQISMPCVGFEPTIPVCVRAKTVHAYRDWHREAIRSESRRSVWNTAHCHRKILQVI
jgi:hypothetical protein